jgi:hypothetical protein
MALIRGGDEVGRNPAIERADDLFSIVTQELDELWLILRLNGQDVDKGGNLFRHRHCRVHGLIAVTFAAQAAIASTIASPSPWLPPVMISSPPKSVALFADTMKTIPVIETDRSGKKGCGFFRVGKHNRCLNLASRHAPIFLEQTALFLT